MHNINYLCLFLLLISCEYEVIYRIDSGTNGLAINEHQPTYTILNNQLSGFFIRLIGDKEYVLELELFDMEGKRINSLNEVSVTEFNYNGHKFSYELIIDVFYKVYIKFPKKEHEFLSKSENYESMISLMIHNKEMVINIKKTSME